MPLLTVDLSMASDKELVAQYRKVHQRYVKAHKLARSIEPLNVSVTDLARIAFRLRKVWLEVMKKAIRSYRLNTTPSFIGCIYRGMVKMIQEDGSPIGKPFFIDTNSREKETSKHTFRHIFDLLSMI